MRTANFWLGGGGGRGRLRVEIGLAVEAQEWVGDGGTGGSSPANSGVGSGLVEYEAIVAEPGLYFRMELGRCSSTVSR